MLSNLKKKKKKKKNNNNNKVDNSNSLHIKVNAKNQL